MDLQPQLTPDQRRYLQAIFDYLDEHGTWPTFKEVDRQLYRTARVDAEAAAKSLSPLVFAGFYSPWSMPDQQTKLPLRVVSWCTGSQRLLDLVVQAVQMAEKKEREEDNPRLSSDELCGASGVSTEDIRKLGVLLQGEGSIWSGGSEGFNGPDESGAWSMGIGRDIRRYAGVTSADELVVALPPLPTRPTSPVGVIDALNRYRGIDNQDVVPPEIPPEIRDSLAGFQGDHPDQAKVAFIMMRFEPTAAHQQIADTIKETLHSHGLTAVRADDKEYHTDTYWNIVTYMHGCGFGIAVFERLQTNEFNPNVALEVGYMLALRKQVCLLKDKTLTALQTDLFGKLYRPFNTQDIKQSIPPELSKWLTDKGYVHS
jgi:nucleoside 2-deoxyribosyltransferase